SHRLLQCLQNRGYSSLHNPVVNHRNLLTVLIVHLVANDNEIHGTCPSSFFINVVNSAEHRQSISWTDGGQYFQITSTIESKFPKPGKMLRGKFIWSQLGDKRWWSN